MYGDRGQPRYSDRRSKAAYVWETYRRVLSVGSVLDVGGDEGHLRRHLPEGVRYCCVGLGPTPDVRLDLERERLPFKDGAFDVVLCLDVLEHLDNVHEVFGELFRVAARHVIVALPNPWAAFWTAMRASQNAREALLKYYGLPSRMPEDRHKWFFSASEAQRFILENCARHGGRVVRLDVGRPAMATWRWAALRAYYRLVCGLRVDAADLVSSGIWALCAKDSSEDGV